MTPTHPRPTPGDGHPPTATPRALGDPARALATAGASWATTASASATAFAAPAPTHTPPPLLPFSPTRTNPPPRPSPTPPHRFARKDAWTDAIIPSSATPPAGATPGTPGTNRARVDGTTTSVEGAGHFPAMNEDAIGNGNEPANGIGTIATGVGTDAGAGGAIEAPADTATGIETPGDGQSRRVGATGTGAGIEATIGPTGTGAGIEATIGPTGTGAGIEATIGPTGTGAIEATIGPTIADATTVDATADTTATETGTRTVDGSRKRWRFTSLRRVRGRPRGRRASGPRRLPRPTRSATRSKPNSNGSSRNKRRNDADANALRIQPR